MSDIKAWFVRYEPGDPENLPLITECTSGDPLADYAGHCPACHEPVWYSHEGDAGPVWTCPANLNPDNPHHTLPHVVVTTALQEARGIASNCWNDFGESCLPDMPLHSACYNGYRPW